VTVDSNILIGMSGLGAACELVGIGLVVKDIAQDRSLARDVIAHEPGSDGPPEDETQIDWRGPLSRLLRIDWDQLAQVNRNELRDALDDAVSRLIEEDRRRDAAIRRFLSDQLAGNLARRLVGVALFAAGVVLAATAQILQGLGG